MQMKWLRIELGKLLSFFQVILFLDRLFVSNPINSYLVRFALLCFALVAGFLSCFRSHNKWSQIIYRELGPLFFLKPPFNYYFRSLEKEKKRLWFVVLVFHNKTD